MARFLIKRIIFSVFTIIFVATLTFFLMNLVPGGPFTDEKSSAISTRKAMEIKYGLDKPMLVRYKNYMLSVAHGDFGESIKMKGRSVSNIIAEKFPVSAELGGIAVIIAILIGMPLGIIAAFERKKTADNLILFFSTLLMSVPSFILGTVLLIFFGVDLKIFPTFGLSSPLHYILPVITLALYPAANITRLMRTSMIEVLNKDYIKTAYAKGLCSRSVISKHALRNAVIPVITDLGPMTAYILTGSFAVESIFSIPGLGGEFINSITSRDYPLIMGVTIFLAVIMVLVNLLVDFSYHLIDPRIRLN
ncbi:MAG: ABC transporter permease [Bacillota bacterium]|nr:ABC transporter permease [Bacillota bacterium]